MVIKNVQKLIDKVKKKKNYFTTKSQVFIWALKVDETFSIQVTSLVKNTHLTPNICDLHCTFGSMFHPEGIFA